MIRLVVSGMAWALVRRMWIVGAVLGRRTGAAAGDIVFNNYNLIFVSCFALKRCCYRNIALGQMPEMLLID